MQIEQKQNRIFRPQSNTTLSAEESNQVTTELENVIRAGNLTPNAGTLTQVRDAIQNVVDTAANELQEQIDAITSASDVFDVVGTYAQLQAYDKTTVPINDIIKVLQDSTHNNAATYYRLEEESGGGTDWTYIGQEGPYYTKSEIDADFALKTALPGVATNQQVGLVKPDGQSVTVAQDGTLSVSSNVAASLPLFTSIWADHILNDASYLRSETFSWQSGSVYTSAYNHLVADISGITSETETISGTTITFYRATDGHKIVLADQESNVSDIFNSTGVAWYYILDTTNQRFKLPRVNPAREELITLMKAKGNGKSLGIIGKNGDTIIENSLAHIRSYWFAPGSLASADVGAAAVAGSIPEGTYAGINTDSTKSGIVIDPTESDTIFAGKKYLYFYVGNTVQDQTTIDVGEITDALNGKVDLPTNKTQSDIDFVVESYQNGTSWYRVYKSGWCEQGGSEEFTNYSTTVSLLKTYADTNYTLITAPYGWPNKPSQWIAGGIKSTNQFTIVSTTALAMAAAWHTAGYLA